MAKRKARPGREGGRVRALVGAGFAQEGLGLLLIGFGLADDRVHSPNEKFEIRCFANGMRAHARLLAELARAG